LKFKLIFLLFNILIFLSFALVIFMPVMMLGSGYAGSFWSSSWYLPRLLLLVVIGIDLYFLLYWRLFSLLETGDWSLLKGYLEKKVLQQGSTRSLFVRSLLHAYFVTGNLSQVQQLEDLLRSKKPGLMKKFVLELGLPKLIRKDNQQLIKFFDEFREKKVPRRNWVRFIHAFASLMEKEHSEGREELLQLSNEVKDPLLKVLVIYTLDPFRNIDDQAFGRVDRIREEMLQAYGKNELLEKLEKTKDNIAIIVMGPLIKDAIEWLYAQGGHDSEN